MPRFCTNKNKSGAPVRPVRRSFYLQHMVLIVLMRSQEGERSWFTALKRAKVNPPAAVRLGGLLVVLDLHILNLLLSADFRAWALSFLILPGLACGKGFAYLLTERSALVYRMCPVVCLPFVRGSFFKRLLYPANLAAVSSRVRRAVWMNAWNFRLTRGKGVVSALTVCVDFVSFCSLDRGVEIEKSRGRSVPSPLDSPLLSVCIVQ